MDGFNLGEASHVVSIAGGTIALMLAALQIADTWLDIGEKLRKRRARKRGGRAR